MSTIKPFPVRQSSWCNAVHTTHWVAIWSRQYVPRTVVTWWNIHWLICLVSFLASLVTYCASWSLTLLHPNVPGWSLTLFHSNVPDWSLTVLHPNGPGLSLTVLHPNVPGWSLTLFHLNVPLCWAEAWRGTIGNSSVMYLVLSRIIHRMWNKTSLKKVNTDV